MERVLVFCVRDWLHPKAGRVEQYVHEVFARIAAQGHYVLWVAQAHGLLAARKRSAAALESVDGIHIARLGARVFYPMMSGMFLSRLGKSVEDRRVDPFDAIVDCVTGYPLPLGERTQAPVIPLVFHLNPKVRSTDRPPGPVIASSERARAQLLASGMPASFIVRAPYGVEVMPRAADAARSPKPTVAVAGARSRALASAIALLKADGCAVSTTAIARAVRRRRYARASDSQAYQRAWFGYCAEGSEDEALEMAACGLPVLCADTEAAREYVEDGRSGFLLQPGHARELADRMRLLIEDDVLRNRLAARAREFAAARSWDKTASLVLATIENLPKRTREAAPPSDRRLVHT